MRIVIELVGALTVMVIDFCIGKKYGQKEKQEKIKLDELVDNCSETVSHQKEKQEKIKLDELVDKKHTEIVDGMKSKAAV